MSCIATHPHERVVASGEIAPRPHIHIWDVDSLCLLRTLCGFHVWGVAAIAFVSVDIGHCTDSTTDDEHKPDLLASAGCDNKSTLLLVNWRSAGVNTIVPGAAYGDADRCQPVGGWGPIMGHPSSGPGNEVC